MYRQINIQLLYVLSQSKRLCFVRICEQTAIISLRNINWLVYITDMSPSNDQRSLYVPKSLIQHSYFLRIHRICVFCMDQRTNNEYFHTEF